jgi:hypothetical protein
MMPTELDALAEMRREAFENEARLQRQLLQLPHPPARWQQWTGGGMVWAGSRLVRWGEGMATVDHARPIEIVR